MYDPIITISLATLVVILATMVLLFLYLKKQNAPMRTTVVQFCGVIIFVPFVFLLAIWDKIDTNTVATLLGTAVGYLFGIKSLKEEWGGTSGESKVARPASSQQAE